MSRSRRCTGGKTVPCELNTFNPLSDQALGSACRPCQEHSYTDATATIYPWLCKCYLGFVRIEPPAGLRDNQTATCECDFGYEIGTNRDGSAKCDYCKAGFYKSVIGNSYCERCPGVPGTVTTLLLGATSEQDCVCDVK